MKKPFIAFLTLLIIFQLSCEKEAGKWKDNIHLSDKALVFKAAGDSSIVTTGGTGWWIVELIVGGEAYHDFEDINLSNDTYKIIRGDLLVQKRDKNTIFIKTAPNPSPRKRYFEIVLESGDYFDRINIGQLPTN